MHLQFSHHGKDRIADRFGKENQRVGLVLNLLLPGTPNIYYGEEIGMSNIAVRYEEQQDPWGKNNLVSNACFVLNMTSNCSA